MRGREGGKFSVESVARQNHNHQGLVLTGRTWGHGEDASATRDAFNLPLAQKSVERGTLWRSATHSTRQSRMDARPKNPGYIHLSPAWQI